MNLPNFKILRRNFFRRPPHIEIPNGTQHQSATQLVQHVTKFCTINIDGPFLAIVFTIFCIIITLYVVTFISILNIRILQLKVTPEIVSSIKNGTFEFLNLTELYEGWKVYSYPLKVDKVIDIMSSVNYRLTDNGVTDLQIIGISK